MVIINNFCIKIPTVWKRLSYLYEICTINYLLKYTDLTYRPWNYILLSTYFRRTFGWRLQRYISRNFGLCFFLRFKFKFDSISIRVLHIDIHIYCFSRPMYHVSHIFFIFICVCAFFFFLSAQLFFYLRALILYLPFRLWNIILI